MFGMHLSEAFATGIVPAIIENRSGYIRIQQLGKKIQVLSNIRKSRPGGG